MLTSAEDIRQALAVLHDLPVAVADWHVETGRDWTEDSAVWVWGILDNPRIDAATHSALRAAICDVVRLRAGNEISIYIRFRATADLTETT